MSDRVVEYHARIGELETRIEALESALRAIEERLVALNAKWALEGGPFDGGWISEVMDTPFVNQQKSE